LQHGTAAAAACQLFAERCQQQVEASCNTAAAAAFELAIIIIGVVAAICASFLVDVMFILLLVL
jgi:hypothetical protein